ncbi:MAG: helix-turn-helix domain-containing protein [Limosilactobacillus sp.]|uniref:winged helix-turn-helix transcriptional regulator n=1 Tax=Limosilactobacillus sp. TaxID=2773925 RepID=UPI00270A4133|nr:helix-turn-helix domain-containing protein [Limosilactobacillus sp.]
MQEMTEYDCKLCPKFTHTFMVLGKKWNGLIIEALLENKKMRFKEIADVITKCSDRVLCERLKELEEEGIIVRSSDEGCMRVDYSLTQMGLELAPVMEALHDWSNKWC